MLPGDFIKADVPGYCPFDHLDQVDSKQSCIFTSSIVKFRVGASAQVFLVHEDVIAKAGGSLGESTRLTDVDPSVFELVLCYLYGGRYKTYESTSHPKPSNSDREASYLYRASQLYYFAEKYGIDQLQQKTRRDIEGSKVVDYEAVVRAAKLVYSSSSVAVAPWFGNYLAQHTKRALADSNVTFEPWFLDIFHGPYGDLGTIIFELFRDMYMDPQRSSTPMSGGTGDISLVHLNECLQADDMNPVSDASVNNIPVSEELSIPDVLSCNPDAIEPTQPTEGDQNDPWSFLPTNKSKKGKKKKNNRKQKPEDVVFDEFDQPVHPDSAHSEPGKVEATPVPSPVSRIGYQPEAAIYSDKSPFEVSLSPKGGGCGEVVMEAESSRFVVPEDPYIKPPSICEPTANCENHSAQHNRDSAPEVPLEPEVVQPPLHTPNDLVSSRKLKKKKGRNKKSSVFDSLTESMPLVEGDEAVNSTIEPKSEPKAGFELSQINPEEHEYFTVDLGLEIHWLGLPYRYIRREKIKGWRSFAESVMTSMPHCLMGLMPDERLWLTEIRVLSRDEWHSVPIDIEATVLHLLREGSKKLAPVHFSMVLYSATDTFDSSAICIKQCD